MLLTDFQQVTDGLSGRVKARLLSTLFFVEPSVKVDDCYYRDMLLKQQMLPIMRHIPVDAYVFRQYSAPAHHARDTIQLLQQETPEFTAPDLWPPNSPDLHLVDYGV